MMIIILFVYLDCF